MNKIRQRRLTFLCLLLLGLGLAASLILYALKQNINAFLTPSQIEIAKINKDYHFRLGGIVKKNSVSRDQQGLGVTFIVTDLKKETAVRFVGVLPDLFREEKGVIAEGKLNTMGIFEASQILAKHDENYLPKNVYEKMRSGIPT